MNSLLIYTSAVTTGFWFFIGALVAGILVYSITKKEIYGTATIIAYCFFPINFIWLIVPSMVAGATTLITFTIVMTLITILIANGVFALMKKKVVVNTTTKKCCSSKKSGIRTKNKYNKRSLYRLAK